MPETAKELSQQPDVRQELARTTGPKQAAKIKAGTKDKFWFVTHALVLISCAVLYFLLAAQWVPLPKPYLDLVGRALRAVTLIVLILAVAKAISVYLIGRIEDATTRFTLNRIK